MRNDTALQPKYRFRILARDGFCCFYCGVRAERGRSIDVDHVLPRDKGGGNGYFNLVAACQSCNLGKATFPMDTKSIRARIRERERAATVELLQAMPAVTEKYDTTEIWNIAGAVASPFHEGYEEFYKNVYEDFIIQLPRKVEP